MKFIAITSEVFHEKEADWIVRILTAGFSYVHLRKPEASKQQMQSLVEQVPAIYHGRLKLHSHFDLAKEYGLGGIHLNSRWNEIPDGYTGKISKSCHFFAELRDLNKYEYAFLSPIFDSICKQGYRSKFSEADLTAHKQLINDKVIALGGITPDKLPYLQKIGFGGAAFLGYLSNAMDSGNLSQRLYLITKN